MHAHAWYTIRDSRFTRHGRRKIESKPEEFVEEYDCSRSQQSFVERQAYCLLLRASSACLPWSEALLVGTLRVMAEAPLATAMATRSVPVCAMCYVAAEKLLCCSRCNARSYCSKDCQKNDWKQHKMWCQRALTLGVDFDVCDAGPSRGHGVFALRDIARGEKVLVERCVLTVQEEDLDEFKKANALSEKLNQAPASIQHAVMALVPQDMPESEDDKILLDAFPAYFKFKCNTFDIDPVGIGICITASRFNHSCLPNCGRQYLADQELMLISAAVPIKAGEELTIRYTEEHLAQNFEAHRDFIMSNWGFRCMCRVCSSETLQETLVKIAKMDRLLFALGNNGKEKEAYALGEKLLALYADIDIQPIHWQRTYFDMFQMAVLRKSTLGDAQKCIDKSLEYCILTIGGSKPESAELRQLRAYAANLETHPLYLTLEP